MKSKLLILVLILSLVVLCSCKLNLVLVNEIKCSDKIITDEQIYGDISSITIKDIRRRVNKKDYSIDVNIINSSENKVVLNVPEDFYNYVTTKYSFDNDKGELRIIGSYRDRLLTDTISIDIYTTKLKSLNLISCKGSIDGAALDNDVTISIEDAGRYSVDEINVDSLNLTIDDASSMDIEKLNCKTLKLEVSDASRFEGTNVSVTSSIIKCHDASKVEVDGNISNIEINVDDASKFVGKSLIASTMKINVDDASTAYIKGENTTLEYKVSDASTIYYSGDFIIVSKEIKDLGVFKKDE